MDHKWGLHNGLPFNNGLRDVPTSPKLLMGLTKYPIRWFLPLKGIVCPQYILKRVVVCDKEMNGVGIERGSLRPHVGVQG